MCLFAAGTMDDLRYPDTVTNYMPVYLILDTATKDMQNILPKENGYEFSKRESFPHCGCAGMWRLLILIPGICEGAKLIVWPAAWRPEPPTGQWTNRAFLDTFASRNTVIPETHCSVFWGLHQSKANLWDECGWLQVEVCVTHVFFKPYQ